MYKAVEQSIKITLYLLIYFLNLEYKIQKKYQINLCSLSLEMD